MTRRQVDATGATRRSLVITARNSDAERAAAAAQVRARAGDSDDARLILAMLGLDDEAGAA